jgi:hypothetical protein
VAYGGGVVVAGDADEYVCLLNVGEALLDFFP